MCLQQNPPTPPEGGIQRENTALCETEVKRKTKKCLYGSPVPSLLLEPVLLLGRWIGNGPVECRRYKVPLHRFYL